jgi:hypothetical protein
LFAGLLLHFFLTPGECEPPGTDWQRFRCSLHSLSPDLIVIAFTLIGIEEFDRLLEIREEKNRAIASMINLITMDRVEAPNLDEEALDEQARQAVEKAEEEGWFADGSIQKRVSILSGARLNKANLRNARLEQMILREANLTDAHLEGAQLQNTILADSKLSGAWFTGADLRCANLRGANLQRAHLEGADLRYAHLERTDLREAIIDNKTKFEDTTHSENSTNWPSEERPNGLVNTDSLTDKEKVVYLRQRCKPDKWLPDFK